MTTQQFKRIARLLKQAYAELESEALSNGMSLASPEYEEMIAKTRDLVLNKMGVTLEEYQEAKGKVVSISVSEDGRALLSLIEENDNKHHRRFKDLPTKSDVERIARQIAEEYLVPPQITNEIVRETTIEQPKIVETTRIINLPFDDGAIQKQINEVLGKVEAIKMPDFDAFRKDLESEFQKQLKHNIDILGMPDFRKLAMGLRADIDALGSGTGSGTVGPGTINEIAYFDTTTSIASLAVATHPSLIELSYVKGVTSAIQTQFTGKASTTLNNLGTTALNADLIPGVDMGVDFGSATKRIGTVWTAIIALQDADGAASMSMSLDAMVFSGATGGYLFASGDIGVTGTRVTKGWFTNLEITNMPTVGGTSLTTVAQTFQNKTITNSNNVLGGVTMTLGSDADGDIYYRASNVLTRLAKGTAGQTLVMNAGATAPEWATPAGGGDVVKVGTPVNNQVGVWTGDGTIEGDADLTFDGTTLTAAGFSGPLTGNVTGNVSGTAATVTGATQAAITTLANLVSVQGLTVTLADAGADAILGWDDSAGAYENLTAAEGIAALGLDADIATFALPASTTISAFGATLVDDADASTARTTLGLVIGTNVQAYDADLTTWAAITPGANVGTALAVAVGTDGAFVVKAGALGTPSSGVGTNITGLVPANIVAGTLAAKINLGEGADTATIGLEFDHTLSADERYSGITTPGTAGATLAFGDLCYLDVTAGEWLLADADAAATSGDVPLGICVDASTDGAATSMLLIGTVRSAAFPASIALGAPVYVGTTAGDIQAAQPSGTDDVVRRVGWAITVEPNTFYFNPSNDYFTRV